MQVMQPFFSKDHPYRYRYRYLLIILVPFLFLLLTCAVIYPNDFKLQSFFASTRCANDIEHDRHPAFVGPVSVKPAFRVLIGVFTTAWTFERRSLLRLVYSKSAWPANNVTDYFDLRFVICNVTNEEHAATIALEMLHHGDIIILNCTENMNNGKTYTYLSSLPDLFGHDRPYDYMMKTDDDTYLRLDALLESLRDKPRHDVYYGLEIPCNGTEFKIWIPAPFMTGLGYVLSWDLLEWIAASDVPVNHTTGPEDMMLGWWLQMGERGKNRVNVDPRMYDLREPNQEANCYRHDLTPDTVAVHRLKDNARWTAVLKYFNVTPAGLLQPSELQYRINP